VLIDLPEVLEGSVHIPRPLVMVYLVYKEVKKAATYGHRGRQGIYWQGV
jgi:hypothetical protein